MKMNQVWKKQGIDLRPGSQIKGKWHHKTYTIQRKLGAGAIGTVYLCNHGDRPAALKISDKGTSMTVEVNVLKSLEKVQGSRLGPSLLDVDDWVSPTGNTYSFYVMEYLQGETMVGFIRKHGKDWIGVFMLQLLEDLEKLHQTGWIFGDLKTENLLVVSSPPTVRWVDVGGTTKQGRAIKEYTEFYDRGYWGLGSRKAEPSYDLFAFVMVFLTIYYPNRFEKEHEATEKLLFKKIDHVNDLIPYRSVLKKALKSGYASSAEMKRDLIHVLNAAKKREFYHKQKPKTSWKRLFMESGGIGVLALMYYLFSLLF
ncbi:protein kinase [Oceanobacillus profundus]|uniref:Protein kinase family protein n=1 Tax=Oceanobacillus profundus TaxID=372463 RepID=A0A417YH04_9BACI|nr:protein kinase [Oceanobacillus profundus]MCM3397995.1 protein kinase [Oceanobacillus profundus]MDO6451331.1 protein kinase [Oceanobacillus profundus]PAE27041.1 serine/threonine protein kinase [Paenibacillus sp. 7884-2]RHW32161.1 protein kinase family protein [Oceanobacillus profundus]